MRVGMSPTLSLRNSRSTSHQGRQLHPTQVGSRAGAQKHVTCNLERFYHEILRHDVREGEWPIHLAEQWRDRRSRIRLFRRQPDAPAVIEAPPWREAAPPNPNGDEPCGRSLLLLLGGKSTFIFRFAHLREDSCITFDFPSNVLVKSQAEKARPVVPMTDRDGKAASSIQPKRDEERSFAPFVFSFAWFLTPCSVMYTNSTSRTSRNTKSKHATFRESR